MSIWQRIRAALRREARDVGDAVHDATERADAALDDRERQLRATPQERLRMEEARAAEGDAAFDELKRRIEHDG